MATGEKHHQYVNTLIWQLLRKYVLEQKKIQILTADTHKRRKKSAVIIKIQHRNGEEVYFFKTGNNYLISDSD